MKNNVHQGQRFQVNNRQILSKWIQITGLISIGLYSLGCLLYSNQFAELHITLPFFDFPIFIGEILLGSCLVLWFIRWSMISRRSSPWGWVWIVCILFVLAKAFYGYKHWGPLAFRHAAMFYYSLFAICGYTFYRRDFFNTWIIILFVGGFICISNLFSFYGYASLTGIFLSIILIKRCHHKYIRAVLAVVLIALAPYVFFFQTSRTFLVGNTASFLCICLAFLCLLRISKIWKFCVLAIFIFLWSGLLLMVTDRNSLLSMIRFEHLRKEYQMYIDLAEERRKSHNIPSKLPRKLYWPERPLFQREPIKDTKVRIVADATVAELADETVPIEVAPDPVKKNAVHFSSTDILGNPIIASHNIINHVALIEPLLLGRVFGGDSFYQIYSDGDEQHEISYESRGTDTSFSKKDYENFSLVSRFRKSHNLPLLFRRNLFSYQSFETRQFYELHANLFFTNLIKDDLISDKSTLLQMAAPSQFLNMIKEYDNDNFVIQDIRGNEERPWFQEDIRYPKQEMLSKAESSSPLSIEKTETSAHDNYSSEPVKSKGVTSEQEKKKEDSLEAASEEKAILEAAPEGTAILEVAFEETVISKAASEKTATLEAPSEKLSSLDSSIPDGEYSLLLLLQKNEIVEEQGILDTASQKTDSTVQAPPKKEYRDLVVASNNILFRVFIWRDLMKEYWREKPLIGMDFGKPSRSETLEILSWINIWEREGWITVHNSFIHILYRAGIMGVVFIGGLLSIVGNLMVFFIRERSWPGILLTAILVNWIVAANFLVILELPYNAIPFWSLLGMTWAYREQIYRISLKTKTSNIKAVT